MKSPIRKSSLIAAFAVVTLFVFTACGGGETEAAAAIDFPSWMANASNDIRTAYTFAVQRPDVLQYVPCYCGCGAQGHEHNEHCFVKARYGDDAVVFDQHGFA